MFDPPDPSTEAAVADCVDLDTVFVSVVADSGLPVFGSVRLKLPTLSIKERFVEPWLCADLA